jgi:hypothetical protein
VTKGFDQAFLVGAGFAVAGAILAFVLIPSGDHSDYPTRSESEDTLDALDTVGL